MILFAENDGVTRLVHLEMELHRDLSEYWEIFNDDPFVKDELIVLEKVFSLLLFVNEKLILLLLVHD